MKALSTLLLVVLSLVFCADLMAEQEPSTEVAGQRTTNTWDGSASTAWALAANWSLNHAPLSTEDVSIPLLGGMTPNYPVVSTTQSCNILGVLAGAMLTISTGTLTTNGNCGFYGRLVMNNASGKLYVLGNYYMLNSSTNSINSSANIYVQGDIQFASGSVGYLGGNLWTYGSGTSNITTNRTTYVLNLGMTKTLGGVTAISSSSTAVLTVNGLLRVYSGNTLTHPYTGQTILQGDMTVFSGGICHLTAGTLSMEGTSSGTITFTDTGNYLNNLTINKSSGASVSPATPITVGGNLNITAGVLNSNGQTITVNQSWSNSVGTAGFTEGTGTVVFGGSSASNISGTETFNILQLFKPVTVPGLEKLQISTGANVTCASYDWAAGPLYVYGTLTANDLADPGIFGTITVYSTGTINFHQDLAQRIDLRATVTISGGTFNVYGGNTIAYFSFLTDAATLNMTSGVLDYKDQGIWIISTTLFVENISGGTIRTTGSFYCDRTDYTSQGILELYGAGNVSISNSGDSYLGNLMVNKNAGSRVTLVSNIQVLNLTINSGAIYTEEHGLGVSGNWLNNAGTTGFVPGTGTVWFNKAGGTQLVTGATNFYGVLDWHSGDGLYFQSPTGISGTLTVTFDVEFQSSATLGTADNTGTGILSFENAVSSTISVYKGGGSLRSYSGSYVNIADLFQQGLLGDFIIESGHLEIHQDNASSISIYGSLSINYNGIVDIYGGGGDCTIGNWDNATFSLGSGELNIKNHGIAITDLGVNSFIEVSGGTIRANGDWVDPDGIFSPVRCIVELTGSGNNVVMTDQDMDPGLFSTLRVNKAGGILTIHRCTIANLIILAADMVNILEPITVQGSTTINSGVMQVNNCTFITGNLYLSDVLYLTAGSRLEMSASGTLSVNSNGYLLAEGASGNPAVISHNETGFYSFNVESNGEIGANYAVFEYMNVNGLNIKTGALIDTGYALSNCTFQNGVSGGKLLTINNSQSLNLVGTNFPSNTWGSVYNISKTSDSGGIYFDNWTGGFGGSTHEQDPFSRLFWEGGSVASPIRSLTIQHITSTNSIRLSWTCPIPVTQYKIYRRTTPTGTFVYIGSSTTTSWSQTVPANRYFYNVTAVLP